MQTRLLPALFILLFCWLFPVVAAADVARIAVATNFAPTAEMLAARYGALSGNQIDIVSAATGKLYAQIGAGAPFDAFLSADQKTVGKLEQDGQVVGGTRFTYAIGQVALWSADAGTDLSDPAAALRAARHVAIANPDLAPYGAAAVESLTGLGLWEAVRDKIVTAENVGQAQSLVASGAAEVGFVAVSGLTDAAGGKSWIVPGALHEPLLQDAALLTHGAQNAAARGFLDYLKGEAAGGIIAAAGYGLP